jgi:hypothetical protein
MQAVMSVTHVVVDGSNIATEGREAPSLAQLDEAVQAFIEEYAPKHVTVVVDATFPNRIERKERKTYESAVNANELITPPAGAIGRGDAFVLQIARRAGATILSNDSFQEFHGDYPWLFDRGRLIGGKPVPHVGWVFMERAPVRGPTSRRAVSEARKVAKAVEQADKTSRTRRSAVSEAAAGDGTEPAPAAPRRRRSRKADAETEALAAASTPSADGGPGHAGSDDTGDVAGAERKAAGTGRRRRGARDRGADAAAATSGDASAAGAAAADAGAVAEAAAELSSDGGAADGGRAPGGKAVEPYNEALPFIEFVARHPVGSEVDGTIERFSSHGAYVLAGEARAYVPLRNLADPAPRSAKEVLRVGDDRRFVVISVDPPRRGIDLALPGVVDVPETAPVEVIDIVESEPELAAAAVESALPGPEPQTAPAVPRPAPTRKRTAAKKAAKKKTAATKTAATKTAAKKATQQPAKKAAKTAKSAAARPTSKTTAKVAKKAAVRKAGDTEAKAPAAKKAKKSTKARATKQTTQASEGAEPTATEASKVAKQSKAAKARKSARKATKAGRDAGPEQSAGPVSHGADGLVGAPAVPDSDGAGQGRAAKG